MELKATKTIVIKDETKKELDKLKKLLYLATVQIEQLENSFNQINDMEITIDFDVMDKFLEAADVQSGTIKASSIHSSHLS